MTKSEYITQKFREAIASGKWKVGEKIPSETQLCTLFSQPQSVRSATAPLVAQGLRCPTEGVAHLCVMEI